MLPLPYPLLSLCGMRGVVAPGTHAHPSVIVLAGMIRLSFDRVTVYFLPSFTLSQPPDMVSYSVGKLDIPLL